MTATILNFPGAAMKPPATAKSAKRCTDLFTLTIAGGGAITTIERFNPDDGHPDAAARLNAWADALIVVAAEMRRMGSTAKPGGLA